MYSQNEDYDPELLEKIYDIVDYCKNARQNSSTREEKVYYRNVSNCKIAGIRILDKLLEVVSNDY